MDFLLGGGSRSRRRGVRRGGAGAGAGATRNGAGAILGGSRSRRVRRGGGAMRAAVCGGPNGNPHCGGRVRRGGALGLDIAH
jgi:hypothetical protein